MYLIMDMSLRFPANVLGMCESEEKARKICKKLNKRYDYPCDNMKMTDENYEEETCAVYCYRKLTKHGLR